jgi:hypothetical protein
MARYLQALLAALLIAGCGSKPAEQGSALTFQRLDGEDTTGLSRGASLLRAFDVERDPAGALRARGKLDLPEGTRLELIVYPPQGAEVLARTQFALREGGFESPPIQGAGRPLSVGPYHFQLRGVFDPAMQPAEVMSATAQGRALRGPGVIHGRNGLIAFVHDQELRR